MIYNTRKRTSCHVHVIMWYMDIFKAYLMHMLLINVRKYNRTKDQETTSTPEFVLLVHCAFLCCIILSLFCFFVMCRLEFLLFVLLWITDSVVCFVFIKLLYFSYLLVISAQTAWTFGKIVTKYSQICIRRSHLGQGEHGIIRQVTS